MSTLWTPGGEHRVPRTGDETPSAESAVPAPGGDDNYDDIDRNEQAVREELAALERELLTAPVEAIIANHCYGFFQLAALHLGQRPPHLDDARLAIDALSAVVDALSDRLGEATATLTEALAQIRLAYVQIAAAQPATNGSGSEPVSPTGE